MTGSFLARWSRLKRERAQPAGQAPVPSASLSPLAITTGSDVSRFLAAGVPAKLTREALRQAWLSEPSIRQFIGIADNQWDFNDPAMPGFGPLSRDLIAAGHADLPGVASPCLRALPACLPVSLPCARAVDPGPSRLDHLASVWISPAQAMPSHAPAEAVPVQVSRAGPARRLHGGAVPVDGGSNATTR